METSLNGDAPTSSLTTWISSNELALKCGLIGMLGGVLYCLRAVYLNKSVRGQWSADWEVWYYLRPITSLISGITAYLFLKAGLIVLDAAETESSNTYGYLAFAFLAGLNVDRFIDKIEEIGKSIFGIEKTRSRRQSNSDTKDDE